MQKCRFCGCTVIVPSELFHHQAFDASVLNERQQKVAEIRVFIAKGQKLTAIKVFRETVGDGDSDRSAGPRFYRSPGQRRRI